MNANGPSTSNAAAMPPTTPNAGQKRTSSTSRSPATEVLLPNSARLMSLPSNIKLMQLAANGPKSERERALIEKLIREHNTIAEREDLRKRLAPKIDSLIQESNASEVLKLLAETNSNAAGVLTDRVLAAEVLPNSIPVDFSDSTSTPPQTARIKQERVSPEPFTLPDILPPPTILSAALPEMCSDAGALTDQVLAADVVPNSIPVNSSNSMILPQTTIIKQERVSREPLINVPPPPPLTPLTMTLPKSPPSASLMLPKPIPPPPLQLPMGIMNVDYSTPSNRLLELTIESEGVKGQLQAIDSQIGKCLEMRIGLLSRMQTIDAERVSLVTVPNTPIIGDLVVQQPNIDADSSLPLGFADLEKYILSDKPATKRKSAAEKPRKKKNSPTGGETAAKKLKAKKKKKAASKTLDKAASETLDKAASETLNKAVSKAPVKVSSKAPVKVASKAPVKVASKAPVKVASKTPDTAKTTFAKTKATDLALIASASVVPPFTEVVPVPDSLQVPNVSAQSNSSFTPKRMTSILRTPVCDSDEIEILEVKTQTATNVSQIPNFVFRLPEFSTSSDTTTTTTAITTTAAASVTVSASHNIFGIEVLGPLSVPPPVTPTPRVLPPPAPPMTLQLVNIASTASSVLPRRAHQLSSDKQSEDTAKRKNIDISSATESNGDKRSRVEELSPDHICLQGEPQRVHFYGHTNAVNLLRVHNDNVFSCSSDGTIKRYSPLKEEKLLDVQHKLIYNHQYIHNLKSVSGLEIFVTKQDAYVIVCTRDGTLKKFQSNFKWALATIQTKVNLTCMTIRWNKIYAGTQGGKIMRFCALKLQFEVALPCSDHPVTCLGTAVEGACRILVGGSLGGDVNIRDALSGLFNRWLKLRPNRYPTALIVVQDRVFTRAAIKEANYEIYIHNVETGNLLHVVEDASGITSYFVSAVDPHSVYFTAFNGYVYKYRSDGRQPLKLDCGLIRGDPCSLYLHKNMVIIGSQQGQLEALIYKGKCCCALETPVSTKVGFSSVINR